MKKVLLILVAVLALTYLSGCGSDEAESHTTPDGAADTTGADSARIAKANESKEVRPRKRKGRRGRRGGGNPFAGGRRGAPGDFERPTPEAIPVEVTRMTRGDIANYLLYSSTLETEQQVDIYPRISGIIDKIFVDDGDRVRQGDKLVQLEQDEYILAEERARLDYEKQQARFRRLKALQEQQLLSEEEFEDARLALRQAEIAWKQAKLNLKYATITAPISGVVGDRSVQVGALVSPSTRLMSIANLEEKIIPIYVPQTEFALCYKGQPATVTVDALQDEQFQGYVKRISPIIDPQSGTFKVTVAVRDPQNKLRPGMFASVELIVDTHNNVPLIPKAALIYENERTYFFVVEKDTARRIELQKGFEDAEKVEVLNPLPEGIRVVVLGQNGLKDGSKVRIVEERQYSWQKPSTTAEQQKVSAAGSRRRVAARSQVGAGSR
ncbi:MAG: efflux RND transporter periplasmic adaptor subunit [Calditrichaeota bacterium]|nr:MAG: efflux RND transporter periplasmic adaptor subunit [Calditrichota bacterium]